MAFTKNKEVVQTYQYLYKNSEQEDSASHLSSYVDIPGRDCCTIQNSLGEKGIEIFHPPLSENENMIDSHSHIDPLFVAKKAYITRRDIIIHDNYPAVDSIKDLSFSKVNGDVIDLETSKRPLCSNESSGHARKRSRLYVEHTYPSYPDFSPLGDVGTPIVSDGDLLCGANEGLINNDYSPHVTSSMSCDMHTGSEVENVESVLHSESIRCNNLYKDVYLSFLDCHPRKHVSLGPDHQVEFSVCCSQFQGAYGSNTEKYMGTCVIPMRETGSKIPSDDVVGKDISRCSFYDRRSLSYIIGHLVADARETIKTDIGHQKFKELGFLDMGEEVAHRWTEEEEHIFHEVVFSNPASLGKNFWYILAQAFPAKSSKEIVSYYYNVFMLRKRSEQNISSPMDVDSDNDEWEARYDDLEDNEQDAVVESPIDDDEIVNVDSTNDEEEENFTDKDDEQYASNEIVNVDSTNDEDVENFNEKDDERYASDDYGNAKNVGDVQGNVDVSKGCVKYKSVSSPNIISSERDFEDDSCTSFEIQDCQRASTEIRVAVGSNPIKTFKKIPVECKDEYGQPKYNGVVHLEPKPWDLSGVLPSTL